jgi:hypothetical protein
MIRSGEMCSEDEVCLHGGAGWEGVIQEEEEEWRVLVPKNGNAGWMQGKSECGEGHHHQHK